MQKILVIILIVFNLTSFADEKRALRFLEKRDYEKLIETLEKDILKDSLNPGPYYIYSLLFNDPQYDKHNLDTSYQYVLQAIELFPPKDEKEEEKLNKVNINDSTIIAQKEQLDFQAYERAKNIHTIESYNFYIINFGLSAYVPNAKSDRNALAYEFAKQKNTYQAYYDYMETYPDAAEFKDAKKQYQILLFQAQTADGTLKSYYSFLENHPDSPFRNDAINEIYKISTCSNTEESYLQFIKDYPESDKVKNAIDRLYHNYREKGKTDFTYSYNFLNLSDSIQVIDKYDHQFVVPVFENDKYGFMRSDGEMIIPYKFDDIDEIYLCGNIKEDFFRVRNEGRQLIASKNGLTIYQKPYNDVQDLTCGLLKILNKGKFGIIFKTGEEILSVKYDEIEKLNHQLMKAKQNNQWFLFSLNGLQILPEGCEDIQSEGEFLLFKKNKLWAITNNDFLFEAYINNEISLDFKYDDYELIEPTQMLCFMGDKEGVLGSDLKYQLNMEKQNIYTLPEGWLIQQDSISHLYDDAFVKISGTKGLKNVVYKGNWLTGQSGDKWILYHNFAPFPDNFAYDSVNILGNNFVFAVEEEAPLLIFNNYKKEKLTNHKGLRIIRSSIIKDPDEPIVDFISIDYDRNRSEIFNADGNLVLKASNSDIQLLGEEYFKKTYRNKTGLIDTSGQVLIKPQYEGIANYNNGYVSLLNNKKFGLYNRNLNVFLKPIYNRLLKPYNNQLLIAYKSGGYGLIDINGNAVTEFIYDEIIYWNDTSLLGMKDDHWSITDITAGEPLVDEIRDFDIFSQKEEMILLFRKEEQYGVVSSTEGLIINPTFNDVLNIGTEEHPIYFTEKYISEAEFYIVIYYNSKGEIIRKQVFTDEEYDKIYCN
jgi:hypothetical protein